MFARLTTIRSPATQLQSTTTKAPIVARPVFVIPHIRHVKKAAARLRVSGLRLEWSTVSTTTDRPQSCEPAAAPIGEFIFWLMRSAFTSLRDFRISAPSVRPLTQSFDRKV